MDFQHNLFAIIALSAFTILLNLPLGYARARTRKYSFRWFLCIHVPIPFIFMARTLSHVGMQYIPVFVLAAIAGQFFGGRIGPR